MADDREWPISLDDLDGPDEATGETERLRQQDPEPQPVNPESALFVLLGVAVTLFVIYVGFL